VRPINLTGFGSSVSVFKVQVTNIWWESVAAKRLTGQSDIREFGIDQDLNRAKHAENRGKIRREANEKALGLLTPEQKEALEKIKGQGIQMQM
jgi:hypothetical protein